MADSKALGHDDSSGFNFVKEMLAGQVTAAVNFDRLQKHPDRGYIIFEFLKCEEGRTVTPYTSHPDRYWDKNSGKFLALWRAKQDFDATLYLVNYAEKGTEHEDQVLLIEVFNMDEAGITDQKVTEFTRAGFSEWFARLNGQCLRSRDELIYEIYESQSVDRLGQLVLKNEEEHGGETLEAIYNRDAGYLREYGETSKPYSKAVKCYLRKRMELHLRETM